MLTIMYHDPYIGPVAALDFLVGPGFQQQTLAISVTKLRGAKQRGAFILRVVDSNTQRNGRGEVKICREYSKNDARSVVNEMRNQFEIKITIALEPACERPKSKYEEEKTLHIPTQRFRSNHLLKTK